MYLKSPVCQLNILGAGMIVVHQAIRPAQNKGPDRLTPFLLFYPKIITSDLPAASIDLGRRRYKTSNSTDTVLSFNHVPKA